MSDRPTSASARGNAAAIDRSIRSIRFDRRRRRTATRGFERARRPRARARATRGTTDDGRRADDAESESANRRIRRRIVDTNRFETNETSKERDDTGEGARRDAVTRRGDTRARAGWSARDEGRRRRRARRDGDAARARGDARRRRGRRGRRDGRARARATAIGGRRRRRGMTSGRGRSGSSVGRARGID